MGRWRNPLRHELNFKKSKQTTSGGFAVESDWIDSTLISEYADSSNRSQRRFETSKYSRGGEIMLRRAILVAAIAVVASLSTASVSEAQQANQQAYGRSWGGGASNRDYSRFNHYPYVYYPQNFYGQEYYRSSDSLYHRYAPEMQIPVYNRQWYNYYPTNRRYHWGHHFLTDVF